MLQKIARDINHDCFAYNVNGHISDAKDATSEGCAVGVARALFKNIHKTSVFLNKVDETTYPSFPVSFHLV